MSGIEKIEGKLEELAKSWDKRFGRIEDKFDLIGRLEERMAALVGVAESLQTEVAADVKDLLEKVHDLEKEMPVVKLYLKVMGGVALALVAYLASEWANQRPARSISGATQIINPQVFPDLKASSNHMER